MAMERPPHIPRDWWYRASWRARQAAVDAHRRANRPAPPPIAAEDPTAREVAEQVAAESRGRRVMPVKERADAVELLLEAGYEPVEIVAQLGIKASSLVRALQHADRRDLVPHFSRLRMHELGRPCPECGRPMFKPSAKSCQPCYQAQRRAEAAA